MATGVDRLIAALELDGDFANRFDSLYEITGMVHATGFTTGGLERPIKHLPGLHNQRSHGRRGLGGGGLADGGDWSLIGGDSPHRLPTATSSDADIDQFLADNPRQPGEELFTYQSRVVASLDPDTKHEILFRIKETYPPNPEVQAAAHRFRQAKGLPDPKVDDWNSIRCDLGKGGRVAEAYVNTPDSPNDPEVRAAYEDFNRQIEEQWQLLTRPKSEGGLGVTVDFPHVANPYPNATEQAEDVRNNHHISISHVDTLLGGKGHSLMTSDDYNHFRAVHDVFGHVANGVGFDRHGEYATWVEHDSMYTDPGRKAMSTEYHGQNSTLWNKGVPEPKSILLPDDLIRNVFAEDGTIVRKDLVTPEAIEHKAMPLVSGTHVIDEDQGIIEALVAVTGVVDKVRDNILPGAFEKTLSTRKPKGVWSHDWGVTVSKCLGARELRPGHPALPKKTRSGEPWPKDAGGLLIKMQYNLDTQRGREAFAEAKFWGDEQEWSIGYHVPPDGAKVDTKSGVRAINHMDVYEYSQVLWGAMPLTATTAVKHLLSSGVEPGELHRVVDEVVPRPGNQSTASSGTTNITFTSDWTPVSTETKAVDEESGPVETTSPGDGDASQDSPEGEGAASEPGLQHPEIGPATDDGLDGDDEDALTEDKEVDALSEGELADALAELDVLVAGMDDEELDQLWAETEEKAEGGTSTPADRFRARHLIRWFERGEGAARIRWGTPGDFMRCVRLASRHMTPERAKGFCNLRHQGAVGAPPGQGHPHGKTMIATEDGFAFVEDLAEALIEELPEEKIDAILDRLEGKYSGDDEDEAIEEEETEEKLFGRGKGKWVEALHPRDPDGKFKDDVGVDNVSKDLQKRLDVLVDSAEKPMAKRGFERARDALASGATAERYRAHPHDVYVAFRKARDAMDSVAGALLSNFQGNKEQRDQIPTGKEKRAARKIMNELNDIMADLRNRDSRDAPKKDDPVLIELAEMPDWWTSDRPA